MIHPLLPMPETNDEISDSYALLGRVLAYATEFEENCRKLAHLSEVMETESEFSYEVYLLLLKGALYEKIQALVKGYKLPDHTKETIHSARKARNKIAHSISLDHRSMVSTKSGRRHFRANIFVEMDALISGNQIVLDITRIIENGRKEAHGSDVVAYFFSVCEWLDGKN